jgi:hypothetical protein
MCQPIQVSTASGYVFGLAVTPSTVYFTDGAGGHVSSCPLSGCGSPTVIYGYTGFAAELLYWPTTSTLVVSDSNNGNIRSVSTTGTLNWEITGQPTPSYLATDGNYLFWGMQGAIGRGYLSSGATAGDLTTVSGEYPYAIWYDPGTSDVFAAAGGGPGEALECTESSACTHVQSASWDNPSSVIVQGSTMYFGTQGTSAKNYADGGLFSAPVNNPTSVTALATGPNYAYPLGMTADSSYVYFFSFQSSNIYKCALVGCGGVPTEIVAGTGEVPVMANDATFVYYGRNGQVMKVAK